MEAPKHPNIFSPEEAVAYLHLKDERELRTLRDEYGLVGFPGVGKGYMYWREDLDRAALRWFGRDKEWAAKNGGGMRITG